MNIRFTTVLALGAATLALAGCNSTSRALGASKVTPDEFLTVAKAPLVVPPDYSLRPPAPGEPRPQELQPESAARQALLGRRNAEARTAGENALVSKAGGDTADPLVRYVVDDEFGDLAHKEQGFADQVLAAKAGQAAASSTATGGKPVTIARERRGGFKLPGL